MTVLKFSPIECEEGGAPRGKPIKSSCWHGTCLLAGQSYNIGHLRSQATYIFAGFYLILSISSTISVVKVKLSSVNAGCQARYRLPLLIFRLLAHSCTSCFSYVKTVLRIQICIRIYLDPYWKWPIRIRNIADIGSGSSNDEIKKIKICKNWWKLALKFSFDLFFIFYRLFQFKFYTRSVVMIAEKQEVEAKKEKLYFFF